LHIVTNETAHDEVKDLVKCLSDNGITEDNFAVHMADGCDFISNTIKTVSEVPEMKPTIHQPYVMTQNTQVNKSLELFTRNLDVNVGQPLSKK